ncbi:MAG: tetratricopeptide repeat protein [Promethearchaeota archaeon]
MSINKKNFKIELERAKKLNITDPHAGEIALREFLKQNVNINEKITLKLNLAYSLLAQLKVNESYKIYNSVLQETIKQKLQKEEADALEGFSNCCISLGKIEKGIPTCIRSIEIYQKLSLNESEAKASNTLACLYLSKGEFDLALEFFDKSLNLTKNTETLLYLMALGNSAVIYLNRGEMEKAAIYSKKSLEKAKSSNFERGICVIQNNLADALRAMGEYSEALKNLEEALELAQKIKNEKSIASINTGIATYWMELGELQKANSKLKIAIDLYKRIDDPLGHIMALHCFAQYWLIQGNFQKAKTNLEEALLLIEKSGVSESKIEILILLTEIYEAMDRNDDAYKFLKQASQLSWERKSEIGHTQVLIQRGRISIDKLDFNEAEMSLNEALRYSIKIHHIILQFTAEMLLAQSFLVKYLQNHSNKKDYDKAVSNISNAIKLASEKKLVPNYISALLIRGLLYSSQEEQEKADDTFKEAMQLAKNHGMKNKAQIVQEKLLYLSAKQSSSSSSSSIHQNRNLALSLALQEIKATTASYVESSITEDDIANTFIVTFKNDENLGPVIHKVDNVDINDLEWYKKILLVGSLYSITLGQGHSYHEGLFGPLPFGEKDLSSIIYSLLIKDMSQVQKRAREQSYLLICLVFDKKMEPIFYDRQKLQEIFDNQTKDLKSIKEVDKTFLEFLRKKILSEMMRELNIK